MPEWRDDRAGAQPDVLGLVGQIHEVEERIGRDREVHAMVLAGPDGVHAAPVRDLTKLDHLVIKLFLTGLVGDALHVHEK